MRVEDGWIVELDMAHRLVDGVAANSNALRRWLDPPAATSRDPHAANRRPTKSEVAPYRKADCTWIRGYPNPRHRG